jgi:hypothetical protein
MELRFLDYHRHFPTIGAETSVLNHLTSHNNPAEGEFSSTAAENCDLATKHKLTAFQHSLRVHSTELATKRQTKLL